jgi:hypothetical protein
MQNNETTAIVKKGNVFDINDVLHDFQANFLNEVACSEWILKRLQSDWEFCLGGVCPFPKNLCNG